MQFYFYNKVMIKGYFYLALSFILSLMFSCSQEVKFVVDIEKAFYEVSTRSENLLQKSGFITYFDKNLNLQKTEFDSETQILELQNSKGNIVAVLIYFETDSLDYANSGMLYPIAQEFSVHSSFCAFIYQKLMNCSFENPQKTAEFCNYFNWNKFYENILKFENPFLLNSDLICNDIATNQFSVYSLKLKE